MPATNCGSASAPGSASSEDERARALRRVVAEPLDRRDLVGVEQRGLVVHALGVAAREVVEVVVHARHHDRDVARAREVAEHLGGAAVAGRVEEQEVPVGVVELAQLAQARVVLAHPVGAQARDLVADRLGVGAVAQPDRRAVEVADQLRPLVGERLRDVGVELLEERRDRGRVGVARDHALEVVGGALERLPVDRRAAAARRTDRRRSGRPRGPPRRRSAARARRRRARRRSARRRAACPTYSAVT